ncbi:putative membrane protein YdjX (TVP38/TMEM64 family) [Bacillus ectoiniformans]|uniref:TVP38/TMEM64 family protein n=1 Tax=Bacillus ectoiniformans TaxID=1494429 RepID=UPI001956186B|nr:TVP38/TMEM64 family protein [Bacillus ectoiniformans]MBM7647584.1 putative membrane protein YdjX (TVP38/TMEM64 family) [Bacillus ectoiniformans]
MKLNQIKEWFSEESIMKLIDQYQDFGLLPGFLLPLLEAFLPFLPLFVFVMANVNAFGLWVGFILSWSGTVVGAFIVFLVFRNYGQRRLLRFLQKYKQVQKLMDWVERHGFGPVFLLLCFPFTPSAVVNIVAGLSQISMTQYLLAVMTGKAVMVFMISFVGYDVTSLFEDPGRTAIVAGVIFVLWYAGKKMESRLNKSSARERG